MEKDNFIEKEVNNFKSQMDPECMEQQEVKTISEWCIKCQITLLDNSYYGDNNKYTIKEFEEKVPRNIQVPLPNNNNEEMGLESVAKQMLPKDFAKKYKAFIKAQNKLKEIENKFKEELITMYESITEPENNSVNIDGIKFTYIGPSKRKSFDSKKFQEDNPELYKKYIKESNVKSSIRTSIE